MIELQNVTKTYNYFRAVDRLGFRVNEGETFGLIGTSGSGKTTTLKMINRLIEADSGSIIINGRDISTEDPVELRKRIGYVIQKGGLFPHYTVAENIAIVPQLLGWSDPLIKRRTSELLNLIGLDPSDYLTRYPRHLSGGQQQRVSLARALAADPPIILMDEPFGGIDPITGSRIRDQFRSLTASMQKTIVLVTHDVTEAFELCDRLALLDRGRLQQVGTPQQLLFRPENSFVKSFFDNSRFQLELQVMKLTELIPLMNSVENKRNTGLRITENASVKRAIEVMEQSEAMNPVLIILDQKEEIIASCTETELLNAFYRKRKQLMRRDKL